MVWCPMVHEGSCPLCTSAASEGIGEGFGRPYFLCRVCGLVFVPPEHHVSFERERREYSLHENTAASPSYVRYLSAMADRLSHVPMAAPRVLDFGSCRGCVLEGILAERGLQCASYDPVYEIGRHALEKRYDVIVLCEVLEHLRHLADETALLERLLEPGGYLLLRTEFYDTPEAVPEWWYANDVTHINFFDEGVLQYLATLVHRRLLWSDHERYAVIGPSKVDGEMDGTLPEAEGSQGT